MDILKQFLSDETGAVTVDWVVLTAAVVGLGIVVFNLIRPAVSDLAGEIAHELEHAQECLASAAAHAACH
jgi:Flp pilus assembly pilin Flp